MMMIRNNESFGYNCHRCKPGGPVALGLSEPAPALNEADPGPGQPIPARKRGRPPKSFSEPAPTRIVTAPGPAQLAPALIVTAPGRMKFREILLLLLIIVREIVTNEEAVTKENASSNKQDTDGQRLDRLEETIRVIVAVQCGETSLPSRQSFKL